MAVLTKVVQRNYRWTYNAVITAEQWRNQWFEPGGAKRSWEGPTGHCKGTTSQHSEKKLRNDIVNPVVVDVYAS